MFITKLPTVAAMRRSADDGDSLTGISASQFYGALAAGGVVLILLMRHAGLSVDPRAPADLPYYGAVAVAVLLRLGAARLGGRAARALGDGAEFYMLFTATALMGAVASYPIAALTHGYADGSLQRIDVTLRFDWLGWYRVVAEHRSLQWLGVAAYESIYLTPAVLLGWYAVRGERGNAYRFLACFWLTAVATLATFALMPAVGPLSHLWHGAIPYMPVSELWQPDLIPALRNHTVRVVDLGQLRGIVSAPSFHAAAATLYIAAAWRTGTLRWPLLWLNMTMLLATPVEGTHYLTDMLIGAAVALAALAAVRALAERTGADATGRAAPPPAWVLTGR